ncbi:Cytochrome P450 [Nonomuraea solani]|uniref:Cytochrome P450 n=1 Tax=Nonomuraea solani TaxID=1144553 RepID=A0A1H6EQT0_9ACTN|nr:cytochrome P450 [Nonomuraea solani]SEH00220.1 Cytochrome P450 [Nonomuraea solani]
MTEPLAALPGVRPAGRPFDPPAELARLRAEQPLWRLVFPDGHVGWLALSHGLVRAVLADPRFSSRNELQHYVLADAGELPPAQPGDLGGVDAPEHTRYRRLLAGKFTVRRMNLLAERAEALTVEHLDAMEAAGPGADLVEAFARPVPAMMICELLGVPYADRAEFQSMAATMGEANATPAEQFAAYDALAAYIRKLVSDKRAHPTDDLLSDLTGTDLTDEELGNLGGFLLGAGLDTTTNMIALGTFALLEHPGQLALLRADPGLAPKAVEELMRFLSIAHTGGRTALEDLELGGRSIRAGESVALSVQAANRDPERFPDPDVLDLTRDATGHVAFGHGVHQCLGQQLARVEMRAALPALVTRFPDLRLAVAPEEVPMRDGLDVYGVYGLPVAW